MKSILILQFFGLEIYIACEHLVLRVPDLGGTTCMYMMFVMQILQIMFCFDHIRYSVSSEKETETETLFSVQNLQPIVYKAGDLDSLHIPPPHLCCSCEYIF